MMNYDTTLAAYVAYIQSREVVDAMEWRQRKEEEYERREQGKVERTDAGVSRED